MAKETLIEIRWHGRGGQGVVTASRILAEASLLNGRYVQAFPEFGPERAGAPVKSFNRISSHPITTHLHITNPDVVVVLDATLIQTVDVCEGISKEGILIINTSKNPKEIKGGFAKKIATVDATDIAMREIKRNIPNTPMIGALVKVTEVLKLEDILEGFKRQYLGKFSQEIIEANLRAMHIAYNEVKVE